MFSPQDKFQVPKWIAIFDREYISPGPRNFFNGEDRNNPWNILNIDKYYEILQSIMKYLWNTYEIFMKYLWIFDRNTLVAVLEITLLSQDDLIETRNLWCL